MRGLLCYIKTDHLDSYPYNINIIIYIKNIIIISCSFVYFPIFLDWTLGLTHCFVFHLIFFSPHTNTIIRFSERGPCIILGSILTSYSVPTFLLSLPLLLLFLLLFGFHWFSLKECVVFLFFCSIC